MIISRLCCLSEDKEPHQMVQENLSQQEKKQRKNEVFLLSWIIMKQLF
jgi:hypothetical protein